MPPGHAVLLQLRARHGRRSAGRAARRSGIHAGHARRPAEAGVAASLRDPVGDRDVQSGRARVAESHFLS